MKALQILDEIRWHDRWSSEIGKRLNVMDSTKDLYIFEEDLTREDILGILQGVPEDLFRLFDLEAAPEEDCDFMADSGTCYRRIH